MKVQDENFQWTFSEEYTEIVTNLVNAPAEMVGEDIEVTKLVAPMDVDRNKWPQFDHSTIESWCCRRLLCEVGTT